MSRVAVRSIHVDGLHGFRWNQLFLDQLDDGINVIYAPNATGKSTLARALQLLFYPTRNDVQYLIRGQISHRGVITERTVPRDRAYPGYPDRSDNYVLDLLRLLEGLQSDGDRRFLQRLIGNGLDLQPGTLQSLRNLGEVRAAQQGLLRLRAAREERAALARVEDTLPALRNEEERSRAAGRYAKAVGDYRSRRQHERRAAEIAAEISALSSVHPGIEKQVENAAAVGSALLDSLKQAEQSAATAVVELMKHHPGGALPDRVLTEADEQELASALDAYRTTARRIGDERQQALRAYQEAFSCREGLLRLLPNESPDALPPIQPADLQILRQAAQAEDRRRAQQSTVEGFQQALQQWRRGDPDEELDLDALTTDLCAWLGAEPLGVKDRRPELLIAVLIVSSGAMLLAGRGVAAILCTAAGLLATALIYYLVRPKASDGLREVIGSRLPASLIAGPLSPHTVAETLRTVLVRRAAGEIETRLDVLSSQAVPASTWSQSAARSRLQAADPYLLAAVSDAIVDYERARRRHATATAAVSAAEQQKSQEAARIRAVLRAYSFPENGASNPELVAAAFTGWFEVSARVARERDEATTRREQLTRYLDSQGIPPGSDVTQRCETLNSRSSESERYRALVAEQTGLQKSLDNLQVGNSDVLSALAADPGSAADSLVSEGTARHGEKADEALAGLSDEFLGGLEERLRVEAEQLEGRRDAVIETQERIRSAEQKADIPEKEQVFGMALAALELREERAIREAVRYRVRTALRERQRKEDLPPLVERANTHLRQFTEARYQLQLAPADDEGLGGLCVYDQREVREHRFCELSTGTKVHAMLALRLALIEEQERGAPDSQLRFPLIVDEAMAVSDPQASEALARALLEIASERQVILFTNQPDDVSLLRELRGDVSVRSVGSNAVGELKPRSQDELPEYRVPHGATQLDPREPLALHAPDAVLPPTMLQEAGLNGARFGRIGEMVAALGEEKPELRMLLDGVEELRAELLVDYPRFKWADISAESWTNNAFRERLRELLDRCRGDANQFSASMGGIPRINQATLNNARSWLESSGYLSNHPSITDIRERVSRRLGAGADPFRTEYVVQLLSSAFGAREAETPSSVGS